MHEGGHGRTANELGKRRLVPDSKADHGVPRNSLNSRSTEFVWVCCLREPYVDLEFGAQGNFQSSHHGSRTGIAFVHRRGQIVHLLSVLQFPRDRPFIQRERTRSFHSNYCRCTWRIIIDRPLPSMIQRHSSTNAMALPSYLPPASGRSSRSIRRIPLPGG